ncbi:MAG TPA: hypothetical protein VL263_21530 [Vicinamibacterales bacterium]|nr:hypothetical protein [Vicinamibacterales bacterium]
MASIRATTVSAIGRFAWSGRNIGVLMLLAILPLHAGGIQPPAPDPFARVSFLVGRWEGTSEGQPGAGKVTREYSLTLNRKFIRVQNRSEYPVQDKNPKGEIHQDEGFISFDRSRKKLVLRQFHVEGFVNQYVEDDSSFPSHIVFTTESIENIPAGWRARETYVVLGPDEFEEVFELAEDGKSFQLYSRARLKRIR